MPGLVERVDDAQRAPARGWLLLMLCDALLLACMGPDNKLQLWNPA
jgi:hypothetical protein